MIFSAPFCMHAHLACTYTLACVNVCVSITTGHTRHYNVQSCAPASRLLICPCTLSACTYWTCVVSRWWCELACTLQAKWLYTIHGARVVVTCVASFPKWYAKIWHICEQVHASERRCRQRRRRRRHQRRWRQSALQYDTAAYDSNWCSTLANGRRCVPAYVTHLEHHNAVVQQCQQQQRPNRTAWLSA